MKKVVLVLALLLLPCWSWADTLKIVYGNLQGRDSRFEFSFAALNLALEKSGASFELIKSPSPMTDARAVVELLNKEIDVVWLGNSPELETSLLPVMIPVTRGLLGYRIPVIRADEQDKFSLINDLSDLKKFLACLGVGWPIADAWRDNELPVTTVGRFESLFKMTRAGRVDYIPFGAGSIHSYLNQYARDNADLEIENHLVVVYPYYDFFFFVHKDNSKLHDLIEAGFRKAYADGSYKNLFLTHPEFAGLRDLKLDKRQAIFLKNAHVTKEELEINPRYWTNLGSPYTF
ncbi:ABC-type amino acid transport substrate-binding protein [Oxalobacteraceae bacterium GrIS 2.11]